MNRFVSILIAFELIHAVVGAAAPTPSRSVEEALFDDVKLGRELGEAALPEESLPLVSVAERMRDVEGMLRRADCGPATQLAQRRIVESLEQLLDQASRQPRDGSTAAGGKVEGGPTSPTNQPGESSDKQPNEGGKESETAGAGPKQPPETEQPTEAEARRVDTERTRAMIEQLWGELPPRRREQVLQLPVEEFLPGYELLIEEYFRRLSEGKRRTGTSAD